MVSALIIFATKEVVSALSLFFGYGIEKALAGSGKTIQTAALEDTLLYGKDREDYLHDMAIFEDVCRKNREYLTNLIIDRMGWRVEDSFDVCHHFTSRRDSVIRHGAISAHKGEPVIIPVNARDGSLLGVGKGNPDWNWSAPHGGGRRFLRNEADGIRALHPIYKRIAGKKLPADAGSQTVRNIPIFSSLFSKSGIIGL